MRFSAVVFYAASFASASAYTIFKRQNDVPPCAQTCFSQTDASPCNMTDVPCLCVNPKFLEGLSTCTKNTCSESDLATAQAWGQETCKAAGIDLQNPVPACAQDCVQKAPLGACQANDTACLCQDPTHVQSLRDCVGGSCIGQDLTTATTVGEAVCRAAGVNVTSTTAA